VSANAAAAPTYSPWARFLAAGEEVVYTEMLEKGRGLFSKRRQLILTTAPRFRYIDVAKMEQKGTIEWHADLTVELKDSRNFIVHTPNIGREWYFECLSGEGARAWVEIVNQMRRH
jgi:3-phosphoinositide dependent protein kinase-1